MKKIYPFQPHTNTWANYSNYLNWTYEQIQSWEDYLYYFKPDFNILNESMTVLNAISLKEEKTIPSKSNPEWKYKIISTNDDGTTTTTEVYCYFPSELNFREGYLNTRAESYLCYFSPPDAFRDFTTEREVTISKDQWEKLIDEGKITSFPISRVIFANKWRHQGVQHAANIEGFNKDNYIMISKPTSVWYLPQSGKNQLSFDYQKNAMEVSGSYIHFALEFFPIRYILNSEYSAWGPQTKTYSIYAAVWDSATSLTRTTILSNKIGGLWTNSYPLMHTLELRTNNATNNNLVAIEDFITDDTFFAEKVNVLNHNTAVYHISTAAEIQYITELWNSVHVNIC